jgi:maltooligosyltrehalose trehalohydrolase
MLFQGQEFASSAPFLYFADHKPELAKLVKEGRAEFLSQFPSIAAPAVRASLADPAARTTFEACKLDFEEREKHRGMYALFEDMLKLRRTDPAFQQERADLVHAARISEQAFVLRFFHEAGDRLLVVNLGPDLKLEPASEPLLGRPREGDWKLLGCSEDTRYGGVGFMPPHQNGIWKLSAYATSVLAAERTTLG